MIQGNSKCSERGGTNEIPPHCYWFS